MPPRWKRFASVRACLWNDGSGTPAVAEERDYSAKSAKLWGMGARPTWESPEVLAEKEFRIRMYAADVAQGKQIQYIPQPDGLGAARSNIDENVRMLWPRIRDGAQDDLPVVRVQQLQEGRAEDAMVLARRAKAKAAGPGKANGGGGNGKPGRRTGGRNGKAKRRRSRRR